jgi:hypothetical protein
VWFPVNHAVAFPDTKAFHITKGGNRFSGCYIDGGRAVFEPAALTRNIWTKGFECCQRGDAASGTPSSGIVLIGTKVGPGLSIINNEFGGGSIFHLPQMWPGGGGPPDTSNDSPADTPDPPIVNPPPTQCPRTDPVGGFDPDFLNASSAGKDCDGLTFRHGVSTLAQCAAACCDDHTCTVYQFCDAGEMCDGSTQEGPLCYTGAWDCTGERGGAAAVASFQAAVLAVIYLCNVCSCQEILGRATAAGRMEGHGAPGWCASISSARRGGADD